MTNKLYIPLTNRSILAISGQDARTFMQGLISNDINKVTINQCIYAIMLTPQGKFLYDFFIYEHDGKLLLDCNATKIAEIKQKLNMYKLRSKITIEDLSNQLQIIALTANLSDTHCQHDPRSGQLPLRLIATQNYDYQDIENKGFTKATLLDYDTIRLQLCIPNDTDLDNSFPLDYAMDQHNSIDYQKGCYVGQEVTARTHYRGTIRKKPYIITADQDIDLSQYKDATITINDRQIGQIRSSAKNIGLALIKIEDFEKESGTAEISGIKINILTNLSLKS